MVAACAPARAKPQMASERRGVFRPTRRMLAGCARSLATSTHRNLARASGRFAYAEVRPFRNAEWYRLRRRWQACAAQRPWAVFGRRPPRLCRAEAAFAHFTARPDPRRVCDRSGCRQPAGGRIRAARPARAPSTRHVGGGIRPGLPAAPTHPAQRLPGSVDTSRQDARTGSSAARGGFHARASSGALAFECGNPWAALRATTGAAIRPPAPRRVPAAATA